MFEEILISAASAAVTSGFLLWLVKEWLSTRLRASIKHEYNAKLEMLKTQLKTEQELAVLDIKTAVARETAIYAAAHGSFAEGQKAAMERRLGAIDKLWQCIVQFRNALPPALTIIDVMTVDEYKAAKDDAKFQALTSDLTPENLRRFAPEGIEDVRPYVGEYAWAVFFCYQALLIRILVLLHTGRTDAEKIEWHKDAGNRNLLQAVLSTAEIAEFDSTLFGKVRWLQQRLEGKILAAAQKIISGESFGAESLDQAKRIQIMTAKLTSENTGGTA